MLTLMISVLLRLKIFLNKNHRCQRQFTRERRLLSLATDSVFINIKRMGCWCCWTSLPSFLLARRHHIDDISIVVVGVSIGVVVAGGVDVGLVEVVVVIVDVVVHVHHQGENGQDEADGVECIGSSEDAIHVCTCSQLLLLVHVHGWHVSLAPGCLSLLRA